MTRQSVASPSDFPPPERDFTARRELLNRKSSRDSRGWHVESPDRQDFQEQAEQFEVLPEPTGNRQGELERENKHLKRENKRLTVHLAKATAVDAFSETTYESRSRAAMMPEVPMDMRTLATVRAELDKHVKQAAQARELAQKLADALQRQQANTSDLQALVHDRDADLKKLQAENRSLKENRENTSPSENTSPEKPSEKKGTVKSAKVKVAGGKKLRTKLLQLEKANEQLRYEKQELQGRMDQGSNAQDNLSRAVAAEDKVARMRKTMAAGRTRAGAARSDSFSPEVAVYDLVDAKQGGLRRIVRVQAPGRYLENQGRATVEGVVEAIAGGVNIRLSKSADIPDGAVFCDPWVVDDPVGTWEWQYTPGDGKWELAESYGFAHGIFAFSMCQSSHTEAARQAQAILASMPLSISRAESPDADKSCIAIVAPISAQKQACSYFRCETVFLGAYGNRIDADDVIPGSLLLGPQGAVEVLQVTREQSKLREVASLSMGGESLSVLVGTKVASMAITDDGAAAEDWAYHDIRELQAGAHEVGLCTPGGIETTAPLQSMALLGQQTSALMLELNFDGKDRAVFVLAERSLAGYMCRSKRDKVKHPNSPLKCRSPFAAPAVHYTSPEHRRRVGKNGIIGSVRTRGTGVFHAH